MAKFKDISDISPKAELQDLDSATAFVDILARHGFNSLNKCIWLGACYCLAARAVRPAKLDQVSLSLINSLSPDCAVDSSPLALSIGQYLDELASNFGPTQSLKLDLPLSPEFFHCLLPAWIFQILTQSEGKTTYTEARQSRSFDELPRLTQWFTPCWVSSYLADQVISSKTETFLDPACGGGHILVEALKSFCKKNQLSPSRALERISGLDIEPALIKLSALSLYLCALDLNNHKLDSTLPLANLFCIESQDAELGSLILGLENSTYSLVRYDNTKLEASSLPMNFDAIAANPPYLGYRLMPKKMVAFLRQEYKDAHYDMYSAFLELASRLINQSGKISFICQQSFLSITRYELLRKKLLSSYNFTSLVSLGSGAFQSRSGEKVSSVIVTLEHSKQNYDLSHIDLRDQACKRIALKTGINSMPSKLILGKEMEETSRLIAGTPILPDCPQDVAQLFSRLPQLDHKEHGITVTNGMFTCDNKRFVKHFSEIKDFEKDDFVPYDKGGGQKWFATTPYRLWWKDQGESIRTLRVERGQSKTLPGEDFYFKQGITYSYIGTRGFKARLLSPGSVFDIASSSLFCKDETELNYLLGFLNTSLVVFILGQLNPTVNFQIGDIRRTPYCKPNSKVVGEMNTLVSKSIELASIFDQINPDSPAFDPDLELLSGKPTLERVSAMVKDLNRQEKQLQNQIDEIVFELYLVSSNTRQRIKENYWVRNSGRFLTEPSESFVRKLTDRSRSLLKT